MHIPSKSSLNPLEHTYRGEKPLATLFYLYSRDKRYLISAALIFAIKHSPTWFLPLMTAHVIDVIANADPLVAAELVRTGVFLAVVILQNIPTHLLYVRFLSIAARNMEVNLRSAICYRLQQISISFYNRGNTGAIQTKLLRDVEAIEQLTRQLYDVGLAAVIAILAALITTLIRAPGFLVFYFVTVPVAVALILALRSSLMRRHREFRQELEKMTSRLMEMTQLIPITRAHGVEREELDRVDQNLDHVRAAGIRLDSIMAVFGASSWVTFQLFNVLCLVAAASVYFFHLLPITLGDVVLLTGYFNSLTSAVLMLSNIAPQITKGFESIRSIGEILECPDLEQNEGRRVLESVEGRFSFENVSFAYPESDTSAVRDFSLAIAPGETVAIVGPSGAGKSTLINLVIGFLRPQEGRIRLDGFDMQEIDLRTYRHFVSVVPQETILFDGTVRENILYGSKSGDSTVLRQAIRDANAEEFIAQFPDREETLIGERGARLSGGQKQRLSIARAFIRNPRVLILDEATSSLDVLSETLIQEALERLMKGRTTFVVAHRLSTIRNASRVVVMDRGRIVEMGSHAELIRKGGMFAKLYEMQLHPQNQ